MTMKSAILYQRGFIIGFASAVYAFIIWLGYWSALLLVPCALGAISAAYVCRRMAKERIRWEVTSTLAEQQMQKLKEGPGTLLESFTMGWFNLILQALWSPILEKHIAGMTGDLLQKVLNEVREKNTAKAPWKYLEAIMLEELRFGAVPPRIQNALAKYDPTASMLTFVMDVTFTSNSAQAVMLVRTKVLPVVSTALNVRLEATYVQFSGRLHLGLLLGQEPPGIKGIYYSFATKPTLDIAVRPLGMALPPELIALTGALQGVLQKIISRRMVEPQRRFFDLHRMYMNRHIARVGGPGGLLRVIIHTAKHLVANPSNRQDPSGSSSSSSLLELAAAAAKVSKYEQIAAKFQTAALNNKNKKPGSMATFVELKFNGQIMRTPVAHHAAAAAAVWEWQLSLALPADLAAAAAGSGVQGNSSTAAAARSAGSKVAGAAAGRGGAAAAAAASSGVCSLAVYEAQSLGEPALLGRCKIYLSALGLKANGDSQDLTLPLQGPNWPKATVTLSLTWLKSTRPAQQRQKWQPQSETVYKPQQQQQQRTTTPGDASAVSLHTQQQQQQQQGHSRNQSNQSNHSVSSLGDISVSGAGNDTAAAAAAASNAAAGDGAVGGGHKSVSWTDKDQALAPSKLDISQSPLAWEGPTSQQQQQQQATSLTNPSPRISRSAGSSPLGDQQQWQQQQQMPYQSTDGNHRRSQTVDLGVAAAAAAGSRSVGATPVGSSVMGSAVSPPPPPAAATASTPRAFAASPVSADRTWPATNSQRGALLTAAAAAATAESGSRPSTSTQQQQQQHSLTNPEDQDSFQDSLQDTFPEYLPKRRPWLSSTSLSGWGSWIGLTTAASSSSSTKLDATAAAAAVRSGSAGSGLDLGLNDAAADPAAAAAAAVDLATAAASRSNGSTPAAAAAVSDFSSPLTMLASVVQLHKQVELQQLQVGALQQQLMAVSSRHIKQQQQCSHNARSALMKGARFVMHNFDGSQQPVLLYLSQQHPSLIAAAAAAAGQKDKSSRSLFGSSDKASRESSFASSNAQQQQQQQQRTPSVVSSKSGRSTPENAQRPDLEFHRQQQQQQLHSSSNESYLVIAALPADGEGFRAAAKRRLAAVLSHPSSHSVTAAAANNSTAAAGKGSPGSSGAVLAPVAAGTTAFSRQERRLLSHVGAYESGELARHDLPVITVILVSQLTGVQLVPSPEDHTAAADHRESHKSESDGHNLVRNNGNNTSADRDLHRDLDLMQDLDCPSLILSVSRQQLDLRAREGVVEDQQTVHLQVPAIGNGRSGKEWLIALEQLRDTPPGNLPNAQLVHV